MGGILTQIYTQFNSCNAEFILHFPQMLNENMFKYGEL